VHSEDAVGVLEAIGNFGDRQTGRICGNQNLGGRRSNSVDNLALKSEIFGNGFDDALGRL